jgi:hypothetical protein
MKVVYINVFSRSAIRKQEWDFLIPEKKNLLVGALFKGNPTVSETTQCMRALIPTDHRTLLGSFRSFTFFLFCPKSRNNSASF